MTIFGCGRHGTEGPVQARTQPEPQAAAVLQSGRDPDRVAPSTWKPEASRIIVTRSGRSQSLVAVELVQK